MKDKFLKGFNPNLLPLWNFRWIAYADKPPLKLLQAPVRVYQPQLVAEQNLVDIAFRVVENPELQGQIPAHIQRDPLFKEILGWLSLIQQDPSKLPQAPECIRVYLPQLVAEQNLVHIAFQVVENPELRGQIPAHIQRDPLFKKILGWVSLIQQDPSKLPQAPECIRVYLAARNQEMLRMREIAFSAWQNPSYLKQIDHATRGHPLFQEIYSSFLQIMKDPSKFKQAPDFIKEYEPFAVEFFLKIAIEVQTHLGMPRVFGVESRKSRLPKSIQEHLPFQWLCTVLKDPSQLKEAPDEVKNCRSLIAWLLNQHPFGVILPGIGEELKGDPDFMGRVIAVLRSDAILGYAGSKLRGDEKFVAASVELCPGSIAYATRSIREAPQQILSQIPEKLRKDPVFQRQFEEGLLSGSRRDEGLVPSAGEHKFFEKPKVELTPEMKKFQQIFRREEALRRG